MKYKYKKSHRTSRTRKKKSVLKNKFFWLGCLILIILGNLVYLFIFSSVFQVKSIEVAGAEKVPVEEIRQIISENTSSIFLTNFEKINKIILEKYPQIANINLKRKLPDILLVEIEERKPVAVLCSNECFFIDIQGVVFEKVSEVSLEMLVIKAQEINQEQVNQILKINSKLKNDLKVSIEEILIVSEKRINVKTLEGWEIYFSLEKDLEWQLTELSILLKERVPFEKRGTLEYIDLRFEKIYIFPETYQ